MVQASEILQEQKQSGSKELRKRLPRGAVMEIANELGLSWVWVHKVITGRVQGDPRIISMALEHARIEDEKRRRLAMMVERNKREIEQIN